jgi:hypothetical protein
MFSLPWLWDPAVTFAVFEADATTEVKDGI